MKAYINIFIKTRSGHKIQNIYIYIINWILCPDVKKNKNRKSNHKVNLVFFGINKRGLNK